MFPTMSAKPTHTRRNFLKTTLAVPLAAGWVRGGDDPPAREPAPGPIDRRPLGRIRTPVSILGLGLGSSFTRLYENKAEEGQALLEKALEFGATTWDTARGYGPSERLIGPVVEKHRDRIFLITKSGNRSHDGFLRDVETSLQNLRTDRLDLLHLWNLPRNANLDEIENGALKAVRRLKEEKVIGHFGISGHSGAAILAEAIRRFDPDAMLTVYPCTRPDQGRYEDVLLPLARERNMGVFAMKMVRQARNADLQGTDLLRYPLSIDGIHSAVVGVDTEAHLIENARMATGFRPLQPEERARLTEQANRLLAGEIPPWERPGYQDGLLGEGLPA